MNSFATTVVATTAIDETVQFGDDANIDTGFEVLSMPVGGGGLVEL